MKNIIEQIKKDKKTFYEYMDISYNAGEAAEYDYYLGKYSYAKELIKIFDKYSKP